MLLAVLPCWGLATCGLRALTMCVTQSSPKQTPLLTTDTHLEESMPYTFWLEHLLPQPVGATLVPFHFSFPLISPHLSCQHQDELPALCVDWGLLLLGDLSNT